MNRFICLGLLVTFAFAGPVAEEKEEEVVEQVAELNVEKEEDSVTVGAEEMAQLMYGQGQQVRHFFVRLIAFWVLRNHDTWN